MPNKKKADLQPVQVRKTRLNLKGKRKKNIVKKAIEISTMLEMDVLLVMRCRDTGRISQYASEQKPAENIV